MFTGYNTDGVGCARSLKEQGGLDVRDKFIFVYDAGGTGLSVCSELARRSATRVTIVDIDGRCEALAVRVNRLYPGMCEVILAVDREAIAARQPAADVVMNLTGFGMHSHKERTPADAKLFRRGQLYYDAHYNKPVKTRFLMDAEVAGCQTLNGLGVLHYQAVEQIKLWTGREADVCVMREAIGL